MAEEFNPFSAFARSQAGQPANDDPLAPAEEKVNPFGAFARDEVRRGRDAVLQQVEAAAPVNPDTFAALRKTAQAVNVDTRILLGDVEPDKLRTKHIVEQTRDFLIKSPQLASFLRDPENARLTYDDIAGLQTVHETLKRVRESEKDKGFLEYVAGSAERILQGAKQSGIGFAAAFLQGNEDKIFVHEALERMTPEEQGAFNAMGTREQVRFLFDNKTRFKTKVGEEGRAQIGGALDTVTSEMNEMRARAPDDGLAFYLTAIGEGSALMLPAIALGIATKRPDLGLSLLYTQAFGDRYARSRARKDGTTQQDSFAEAFVFAGLEAATERVPLGVLLSEAGRGLRAVLKSMGAEAIQETFMQYIDIGFEIGVLNKEMTVNEALESLRDAAIIGGGVGGLLRGGVQGGRALAEAAGLRRAGDDAQAFEGRLTEAQKAVVDAKLAARSPEKMREFLNQSGESATVHISAEDVIELQQSGVLTDAVMAELELNEEMAETSARNGDFEVSVAKLLTLDEKTFSALSPSVRATAGALSSKEATQQLADRETLIQTLVAQMEEQAAADPEARPIADAMSSALMATGTFTPAEAQEIAGLTQLNYEARVANMGGTVTAEELFLEENVVIRGPADTTRNAATIAFNQTAKDFGVTPEQLRQELDAAGGDLTQTPRFKAWFKEGKVVDESGAPRVVYHGTSKDMDFGRFNIGQRGAWFTTSPQDASSYAESNDSRGFKFENGKYVAKNTASRVMPAYLALQNPYTPTAEEMDTMRYAESYSAAQRELFNRVRSEGFDGVDMGGGTWVAFDATQIKSIFNKGTFDPTDPRILNRDGVLTGAVDPNDPRFEAGDIVALREMLGLPPISADARPLMDFIKANPDGFTVDVDGKTVPVSGFAVAPLKGIEIVVAPADLTEDNVRQLIANVYAVQTVTKGAVYAGGWLNKADGMFYLDATQVFDTEDQALYAADAGAQIAIFDLGTYNEINTEQGLTTLRESGAYSAESHADKRRASAELATRFEEQRLRNKAVGDEDTGLDFNQDGVLTGAVAQLADAQRTLADDPGSLGIDAETAARVNPIYRPQQIPRQKVGDTAQAAEWLEGQYDGDPISDFTAEVPPEALERIAKQVAAEARLALLGSGNAANWYSSSLNAALDSAALKYPMLRDDAAALQSGFGTAANARFVFTYIMAVTSQNLNVTLNSKATDAAFEAMVARVRDGKYDMLPEWGTGEKQEAMAANFRKFGALLNAMPGADFPSKIVDMDDLFKQKKTVSEWVRYSKEMGIPFNVPGQTVLTAEVYGSSTLGPKIGNGFWQNLNGNFDPLTIDLWKRRTWGRMTGVSIGNPNGVEEQRARLKAAITRSRSKAQGKPEHIAASEERVAVHKWMLEQFTALPDDAFSSNKARAEEEKRLRADLTEAEEVLADIANIKAPEGWKPEYRNNTELLAYSKRLLSAWNKEYKQLVAQVKARDPKAKLPPEAQPTWARAAKTVITNLAKPLDTVNNGTQRTQIEKADRRALEILREQSIDLTTADLQALLWFPEKELWGALTTNLGTDEDGVPVIPHSPLNESYDGAFARILKEQGYAVPGREEAEGAGDGRGAIFGQDVQPQRPGDVVRAGQARAEAEGRKSRGRGEGEGEGEGLGQNPSGTSVKGSFRQEKDIYGNLSNILTLTENADRTTFLHELGHFWLFQLHKDLADPRLTAQGKARLERMLTNTKEWFGQNAADGWRDFKKMEKAAREKSAADPTNASLQRKSANMTSALRHAEANGGADYMRLVAQGFMQGNVAYGTDLEVGFHEMWARGVEKWLGEGRAPSAAMREPMSTFSTWVIGVYKRLRNLNVNLTQEIRGVFDRLVATEDAINSERTRSLYNIPNDLRAQATAKELAALDRAAEEAMTEARAQMQGKVGRQLARERGEEATAARAKLTEEVTADVSGKPIYKIDEILKTGGTDGGQLFFDRAEFIAVYGEAAAKKMPRGSFTKATGAEIIEMSVLAKAAGFEGQEAMVNAMLAPHPSKAIVIKATVDQRLGEMFGSTLQLDRIQDDAVEVVQNERMIELMALQAKLVRRLAKGPLKSAAERRAQEEGVSTTAAEDRGAVEDAERGAEGAPTPQDAIPGELRVAQTRAEKEANVGQRKAQTAAVAKIRELARSMDIAAIKEAARRITDNMTVGKLTSQKFRQTADRLAKKAHVAIAKRDYAAAADLLQERTLNLEIAREATVKRDKIDRQLKRVQKTLGRGNDKLKGRYDIDIIQAARMLVEPYGVVRERSTQMNADEFIRTLERVDAALASRMANLATDARRNAEPYTRAANGDDAYKQMPYKEFAVLMAEVNGLITMARDGQTVKIDGERVTFDHIVEEVARTTIDLVPLNKNNIGRGTDAQRNWITAIGAIRTWTRRVEAWARSVDGGDDGPMQKFILRPVLNGITAYHTARIPIVDRLHALLLPVRDDIAKPTRIDAPELDGYFFGTKGELLHFLLHTGNESNKRKLLIGGATDIGPSKREYKWTNTTDPREEVNTDKLDAFINRIFSDGTITFADVKVLNGIWAIFEDTKTDAQKAHREMHGHFFDEIKASPRQTGLGLLTGGYVPALYDNLMNPEGVRKEAADDLGSAQNAAMFPGAEDGFTKGRVEYNQPLALDLRMIAMHLDKVLKFSHIGPPVRNAARIVVNKKFQAVLNKFDHFAAGEMLIPWLNRSARQTVTEPGNKSADKFFTALSRNIGLQTMMGNIVNAAQQLTGLITATTRIDAKYMIKSHARFRKDGESAREYISRRSPFMAGRLLDSVNDLTSNVNNILTASTPLQKGQFWANKYGYILQQMTQNVTDAVVWGAAEEQARDRGLWQKVFDDHAALLGNDGATVKADAAVAMYADEIVRSTQTPLGPQDISRMEAIGSFGRLFMKFQGYFNNMMNLSATEFQVISRDIGFKGNKPGRFFYLYLAGIAAPAIVAQAIAMAAGGDFDDLDEKDSDEIAMLFFNLFVVSQGKFVGNFVPGLGSLLNFAWSTVTPEFYDDRLSVSPVLSIGESTIAGGLRLVKDGIEYAQEGSFNRDASAMVKDALNAVGVIFGLPTGWFNKPVTYLMKVSEGKADPEGVIDYVQGFLKGRDSTE